MKNQNAETFEDNIVIDNGIIFEGTREMFRDCFFDNASNENIINWCKWLKVSLTIDNEIIL
jgi:hypothetical protein